MKLAFLIFVLSLNSVCFADIMQEREQVEAKTLFDSKEVNLNKDAKPEVAAETKPAAAVLPVLKESEVPVQFDSVKEKSNEKGSLGRVLISLGVVFSLLGAAIYGLKKWSKKREILTGGMKIRVMTQHHLGPKKSIAIIQVAGESILVGITDHNISMLKTLALIDDEIPADQPNKFDDALYNFEEEAGEIGKHFSQPKDEVDDFALRGISEIRDVVSKRLKGMRQIE